MLMHICQIQWNLEWEVEYILLKTSHRYGGQALGKSHQTKILKGVIEHF